MRKLMVKWFISLLLGVVSYQSFAPNLEATLKGDLNRIAVEQYLYQWELNRRIEDISKVIRSIESKSDYRAVGLSGEYGAYQFSGSTWRYYCTLFFGRVLDISDPYNQDMVVAAKVRHLIKRGYTDEQIASIWNCGSPTYKGKVGVNSMGVHYNVPLYVSTFIKELKKVRDGRTRYQ